MAGSAYIIWGGNDAHKNIKRCRKIYGFMYVPIPTATRTINAYRECFPEADESLKAWVAQIKGNKLEHFPALKKMFPTADFVKPDRIIFNIRGNHFRLITAIDFERQVILIKWFGRHRDYDKINPSEVQHEYPPC